MSGAQGKSKLVRKHFSTEDPVKRRATATAPFKQARINLAEKRLLALRCKLQQAPRQMVNSVAQQRKVPKTGNKRKVHEGEVLEKVKKPKAEVSGIQRKFKVKKIPKLTIVEDQSDDDIIIEIDKSPNKTNSLSSHSFTVVSEATVSGKSPLKQRLKRLQSSSQSDSSLTPSTSTRSTVKLNRSSQCSLTPAKVQKINAKSKLSDRLSRIRDSQGSVLPKSLEIANWIESTQPQACSSDVSVSDSLMVNLDSTLMQNSMILTELQDDDSMEWDACSDLYNQPVNDEPTITAVVIDTNVFMHNLSTVKDLLEFKGNQDVLLYVPFMVLQELDYIKDHNGPYQKCQALAAQKIINKYLSNSPSRLIGQTVDEVCEQRDLGKSPDDKILACCMQVQIKYPNVMLLSNDINLRNKALTNNIQAYSSKEILNHLRSRAFQRVVQPLEDLLSKIILHCCQQVFGSTSSHIEMLQGSPWSFKGCLERFQKYWSTVFRDLLLKQSLKTAEELMVLLEKGGSDLEDVKKFKSKVKEFLFYLQDIAEYSSAIKKVRDVLL